MEQERSFIWAEQKHQYLSSKTSNPSFDDDSWEQQAFAEDAAGPLGGCIWPPRSYSCSFCRREFRSAQALGGHMNVHRRDRARLKQSPNSHIENDQNPENRLQNPLKPLSFQYPSPVCTLIYNPNPKSTDLSRVSAPVATKEYCSIEQMFFPPYTSSSVVDDENYDRNGSKIVSDPKSTEGDLKISKILESDYKAKENYLKTVCCKRKRTDHRPSISFFLKSTAVDTCNHVLSEASGFGTGSIDVLDLELRLGGLPPN